MWLPRSSQSSQQLRDEAMEIVGETAASDIKAGTWSGDWIEPGLLRKSRSRLRIPGSINPHPGNPEVFTLADRFCCKYDGSFIPRRGRQYDNPVYRPRFRQ